MVSDSRFDLERARAEARAAKAAAKRKALVSNIVMGVTFVAVAIGAKVGWDAWSSHREKVAEEEAEAARQAEAARVKAEREAKAERERREAEARARRAAEEKAREEKREAEKREREEKRRLEQEAREKARADAAEARARKEADEIEQRELKAYAERTVRGVGFSIGDHFIVERELEDLVEVSVEEERWAELSLALDRRDGNVSDFLGLLDPAAPSDDAKARYPSRETIDALLAKLAGESFTLVVRAKSPMRGQNPVLVAADPQEGFVEAPGCRAIRNGRQEVGWTAPFVFGSEQPLFLMKASSASRYRSEWKKTRRRVQQSAAKLDNAKEFVASRLEGELKSFVKSVSVEIRMAPAAPQEDAKKPDSQKTEKKNRSTGLKGMNDDIRSFKGPGRR